jgi:hypothetical protein
LKAHSPFDSKWLLKAYSAVDSKFRASIRAMLIQNGGCEHMPHVDPTSTLRAHALILNGF